MNWRAISQFEAVSECGQYGLRGSWRNGHFAWRGREVSTDTLIAASQDRGIVELCCERHAAKAMAAAVAEARA